MCEFKLRDAEFLLSIALVLGRIPVLDVKDLRLKVDEGWRLLLVNQFHDVLPGSSIELAHTEAKQWFHKSIQLAKAVADRCVSYIGTTNQQRHLTGSSLINTLPWSRLALVHDNEVPVRAISIPPMSLNSQELKDIQPVTLGQLKRHIFQKTRISLELMIIFER